MVKAKGYPGHVIHRKKHDKVTCMGRPIRFSSLMLKKEHRLKTTNYINYETDNNL
jgi:hypothetical protein